MPRHLALPLTITDRGLASLEQDSPAEIAQSVATLLDTQPGERRSAPAYGYPSPLGIGVDVDEIADVIEEHEPRADPALVELTFDQLTAEHVTVHPAIPAAADDGDTDEEG